jgi:Cyclic nucleotide-binding domain
MNRYLVVANQTLGGDPLLAAVRARLSKQEPEFYVLVPASAPRGTFSWTESEASMIADDRLDRALSRFRELGARAEGSVGDADPFLAIEDVLREQRFDEIIISTYPRRMSRALKTDLPGRIRAAHDVPIIHITSPPEPAPGENALTLVPLFATLSKRRIRALARASVVAEYRDGKVVVKAGTSGSDLFVILDGRVKVVRGGRTVARMGAGEMFGEISLLDPGPRTADVIADGPARCLHLSGADFQDAIEADPKLALAVLRAAGTRLREFVTPIG